MKQTAIDKVIMSKRIESVKEHAKTRKAMKNAEKKVKGAIIMQGKQKKARNVYSDTEKQRAVAFVLSYIKQYCCTKEVAINFLRVNKGYHDITIQMINRWQRKIEASEDGTINRKRGKPIDAEFEAAVVNKLILIRISPTEHD